MNEKSLNELLSHRQGTAASSLPPNFQQNVWRAIRVRRSASSGAVSVWQWLLGPRFVTALLTVAVLVGIGLGSRTHDDAGIGAREALNLEVFGASAPTLPSTILASHL